MSGRGVTIDLSKNKKENCGETTTYQASTSAGGKTVKITVKRTIEPKGSHFYRYTHSPHGGRAFTLKEIQDNNKRIEGIQESKDGKDVYSVSAYYWKHDNTGGGQTPGKVLLIGVSTSARTTYYVRSSGNRWTEYKLDEEDLEHELDEFVCKYHNGVTIDLTRDKHRPGESYCCDKHADKEGKDGEAKVSVTSVPVSCKTHSGSSHLTVKKHTITSPNLRLAGIKYNENSDLAPKNRRRIKLTKQSFPITDVDSVHVFYCQEQNPLLIYIHPTTGSSAKGWYKKKEGSNDSGNEEWEETLAGLRNTAPEKITDCTSWNALVTELKKAGGYNDLQECPGPKPPPPPEQQESGTTSPTAHGHQAERHGTSQPSSNKPPLNTILGVLSGTAVVSGSLTGLGWWAFKRSRGDPWVRQI
ncbi:hypothetical protein BEWA_031330 [Theileria equi strain WA]|uniref:Uncharacterized protein n=1 Tax=Theileria equi strain WA TaxID=1537102 RepID=L0AXI5_THEEQ|nr:hypothetical protein BEWA_031330 [Theileria equi strain WA]AFZ80280.1 hypothetical protein BEWA_031330 [Theileria equi strain WA]|eukprot:XP_004829946.1 hypothetical protein BEWA_031330 [Theileria equi strain WA]